MAQAYTDTSVMAPGNFARIAANGTTIIKTGAGVLVGLTINTAGAAANTLTLYDNTAGSGTVIALINTVSGVESLLYNVIFGTGLTAVLATGTAADITFSYR